MRLIHPLALYSAITLTLHASHAANAGEASFPAPKYLGDETQLGRGVQRTMNLLASSTPDQRHTVRVLFYGQSITAQDWSRQVAEDLRKRFPNANLIIENRSIGGHSSQRLVKTAEADLYPFQPDLVIFHVYGSHTEYENIIRNIRERTTAEVLIQNDHVNKVADLTEEMDPVKIGFDPWDSFMNHKFLPAIAAKYHTGYLDQRAAWKRYLADFDLAPSDLLRDGIHLNDHGCFLMARLVNAYLRVNPAVDDGGWKDWVRTIEVGDELTWEGNHLSLEFEGDRVDAIAGTRWTNAKALEVWIDGKRPSDIARLRTFNRVSAFPQSDWPCLLRVQSEAPRWIEDWTLTLTEASDDLKTVKFTLKGSVTGEDGEGISTERFVSRSGRIVVEPEDWNLAYCRQVYQRSVPAGHRLTWKVVPLSQDTYRPTPGEDPSIENSVILAQGLGPGLHRLELRGESAANLSALRVYCPGGMATGTVRPFPANPILPGADPHALVVGNTVWIYPTRSDDRLGQRFFAFSSTNLTDWQRHGPVLDFKDVPWIQEDGQERHGAWAPGVLARDGGWYFYYSVGPQNPTPSRIGVAVGDSPAGPFRDSGRPLLTGGNGFEAIDPMPFTDPASGKTYLYAGGSAGARLRVFEMKPDLVSFAREIPVETPPEFTEGVFLHVHDGRYYLSYSHGGWQDASYSVRYATSASPTGPWDYRGAILTSDATHKGPGHHSFIHDPRTGEFLIVYHRWENQTGNGPYRGTRQTCVDRVEYDANGLIQPITMTPAPAPKPAIRILPAGDSPARGSGN